MEHNWIGIGCTGAPCAEVWGLTTAVCIHQAEDLAAGPLGDS